MKKILSVVLASLLLFGVVSVCAGADGAQITAQSVSATPGQTVTVPVAIAGNPGFCYLKLGFSYDAAALELVRIDNGSVSSDAFEATEKAISWDTAENATGSGTLVTFTFKVKPDAALGDHAVTLNVIACYNYDEKTVAVSAEGFTITVKEDIVSDFMPGDVDMDKKVTASDARLALRRAVDLEDYAEGSPEFLACDVDKDGKVTASDARIILRVAVGLETL